MKTLQQHPINQSPLYKITSPARLAKILKISQEEIEQMLINKNSNYSCFYLEQKNNNKRYVEAPKNLIKKAHVRIFTLLSRIEPPEYLQSATKERSYITNASAHIGKQSMIKVDIKKFYPSTKRVLVYSFFDKTMGCAGDVAGILANIITINGHLPIGSCASLIMSFYAHKNMFDEINEMATKRKYKLTIYVDDICITGIGVSRKFLYEVRKVITRYGLRAHKAHYFPATKIKIVTGVAVDENGNHLPNCRHKRIKDDMVAFHSEPDEQEKLKLLTPLIGRINEAAQIDKSYVPKAQEIMRVRKKLRGNCASIISPKTLQAIGKCRPNGSLWS